MSEEITAEQWSEATATQTLSMEEMDILVKENQALWAIYEEKHKAASAARVLAENSDSKVLAILKASGKSKYFVDGLGTISQVQKSVVRVPHTIETKKEFFKFLREKGEEVLYSMLTVNSNTLNSWYASQLDEALSKGILGFSVPGIEQPTMRESLRFTAERKKKNGNQSEEI